MPTEITVRGTFSTFQAPERATVHATIAFEGPAMEPVYDRVARDLESLKASVTPLKTGDHGPVTWWSAEQLQDVVEPAVEQGRDPTAAGPSCERRDRGEVP